jgi:hypothetical protein
VILTKQICDSTNKHARNVDSILAKMGMTWCFQREQSIGIYPSKKGAHLPKGWTCTSEMEMKATKDEENFGYSK